jgi:hypothetical protein
MGRSQLSHRSLRYSGVAHLGCARPYQVWPNMPFNRTPHGGREPPSFMLHLAAGPSHRGAPVNSTLGLTAYLPTKGAAE